MAPLNDEIREIMVQSRAERQALFEPVSEVSRRLQPRHLVDVATHYAKHKVAGVVGGVAETIKQNGGTAAAVALGAVAVFDAGRRSNSSGSAPERFALPELRASIPASTDSAPVPVPDLSQSRHTVTNLARAKALAGSAAGLLIGHVIGRAFQPTASEQELFGKAGGEVQDAASKFVSQHSHGAKVAAAQAFGFARYSAAFLAVMATVGAYMNQPGDGGDPPA